MANNDVLFDGTEDTMEEWIGYLKPVYQASKPPPSSDFDIDDPPLPPSSSSPPPSSSSPSPSPSPSAPSLASVSPSTPPPSPSLSSPSFSSSTPSSSTSSFCSFPRPFPEEGDVWKGFSDGELLEGYGGEEGGVFPYRNVVDIDVLDHEVASEWSGSFVRYVIEIRLGNEKIFSFKMRFSDLVSLHKTLEGSTFTWKTKDLRLSDYLPKFPARKPLWANVTEGPAFQERLADLRAYFQSLSKIPPVLLCEGWKKTVGIDNETGGKLTQLANNLLTNWNPTQTPQRKSRSAIFRRRSTKGS